MKLTTIILLSVCLAASAKGNTQGVTLSLKNASLEKVFREIKKQTGYSFIYTETMLKEAKPVSIEVKNTTIDAVLQLCFANQPFSYEVVEKTIVLKPKEKIPNDNSAVILSGVEGQTPPIDISGRITNAQGEPLAGASVIIKRTGKGDIANANGNFSLKGLNNDDVILISYTGYKTQSIRIGDKTNFIIALVEAVDELDRMVVQAYGKTTQRLATGNIAKVTAEEIERQPVMNPLLALQGKVAGLDVTQTNGFASAPIKVELRGRNTIGVDPSHTFPSDPLYIIDGVPLTILDISGTSNYQNGSRGFVQSGYDGPANGQSPLFSLNPTDIESIEVLKDADATAIYGSRGANGVILITTKRGKAGKSKFDLHIQEGISKQTRFWSMMNTQQYLQMRREALKNDGITPSLAHGDFDLLQWDTTRYTDWQRVLYGNTGKTTDIEAAITGGNEQTTFRIGAAYNHTTNILTVSGADQRASLSLNISHRTLNQKLSIGMSNNFSYTQSDMVNLPNAITLAPNAPPIFDSAGNLNFAGYGTAASDASRSFPFGALKRSYVSKTNFLNSNFSLVYVPFKGFNFTSNFGYNSARADQDLISPLASLDSRLPHFGEHTSAFNNNRNWIIEPQATYETFIGKGKINFLIGGTWQSAKTNSPSIDGYGYASDDLIQSISSAPVISAYEYSGQYKYAAFFSRISYNWQNKYLLNINARRDGSSRFGSGMQYGNFGSIGCGWVFSEEKFFKNSVHLLSFGKIRANYGTTGSDAIGDYQYLTQWSSNGAQPYTGITPLLPRLHANPNFRWQQNKKLEAAIDFGLLSNRLNFSVAYYQDRCGNQLVQFPTPAMTGFTSVTANYPALVQNSGWEFTMTSNVVNTKNFKWGLNFNAGINRNKLVAYPGIEQSPFKDRLVVGKSLNIVPLLHYTGVNPQTGEYTFEDRNRDGQIRLDYSSKDAGDLIYYDLSPKFSGGLGMNFNYKALQLILFFVGKKQMGINALAQSPVQFVGGIGNQPAILYGKEWKQAGDIATIARFSTTQLQSGAFFSASDIRYSDASFIRLSNLSISYQLPYNYINKIGMKGCSIFFHTNNLFTITNYKGIDPETQSFGSMPPAKTIVLGINFNF